MVILLAVLPMKLRAKRVRPSQRVLLVVPPESIKAGLSLD
ncbi:MAG: hypothetical protein ACJAZ0_001604 [Halioglobus sp.]|jgi:hypothetical protein